MQLTTKVSALALFSLLCSACAGPSKEELAKADFGTCPEDYKKQITDYFDVVLKDPESARYLFGKPYRASVFRGVVNGGGYVYGYAVPVRVNAKNSYGGYTGGEDYICVFHDGQMNVLLASQELIVVPADKQ